jgi:hypothetical protein
MGDEASKEDVFLGIMENKLLALTVVQVMNESGAVGFFEFKTGFEEK